MSVCQINNTNSSAQTGTVLSILTIQHNANLKYIHNKEYKCIELNNQREDKKKIPHEYKISDTILVSKNKRPKHGEREKNGPFPIVQVNNNGTVRYDKGKYSNIINIF